MKTNQLMHASIYFQYFATDLIRRMNRMNSVLRPVDNLGHIGRTYLENNNAR